MTGVAFVVAVVSLILAVVFWLQGRSAAEAVAGLKAEADAARKDADAARAQAREAQAEAKARSAQVIEAREKLNELRKRGQDKALPKRSAREAELEEDLAHARRLAEEALGKAGLPVRAPAHKERRRATGPAAAERAREEEAGSGAGQRPEPVPAEPPSAGAEPISAAAAQPNGIEVHPAGEQDADTVH